MEIPSKAVEETEEYFNDCNSTVETDDEQRHEIEEMFSVEVAGFYADEKRSEEMYSFSDYSIEEIETFIHGHLKFFSCEERDYILLNFISGKTQVELTEIFDKTQPALCYNGGKIKEEIKMARKLNANTDFVLDFLMSSNTELNLNLRKLLLVFFYSLSFTRTANIIGINPMICRTRLLKTIDLMKYYGYDKVHAIFQEIFDNLNGIKKEVTDDLVNQQVGIKDAPSGKRQMELEFEF